ncbi:hypothetical protein M405DRAFT_866574 [Rhizopogon salebrosus TDB-379]|nr:hypothetical protein M405DRAFT_866574 [Rhizopogon salebrosus TDB-379]
MYYSTSRLGSARKTLTLEITSASPVDAWKPASPPVLTPPHPLGLGPDQGKRSPTDTAPYKCHTVLKWQEGLMEDKIVVLAVALCFDEHDVVPFSVEARSGTHTGRWPSSHSPYSTIAAEGRDSATPEDCVSGS